MPIPPPPFTLRCPGCGWSRTVIPRSDALFKGLDWFECCPQCQEPLQQRTATTGEIIKAKLQCLFDGKPG